LIYSTKNRGILSNISYAGKWFMADKIHIGHGYDAHRLEKGYKLILGGVEIPYEMGLAGHSDADVLTHSVIDALLGACVLGDIGWVFPADDEQYRGISSLILLERTMRLMKEKCGGHCEILNIDCTVIAQNPKLSPYKEQMRDNLADVLNIEKSAVNIKATTEEGLGFSGRGEGIAAHCVCLLTLGLL
jgi:2-C-methyl-D-erythritol 2,4-cyclodiphosphate synthase